MPQNRKSQTSRAIRHPLLPTSGLLQQRVPTPGQPQPRPKFVHGVAPAEAAAPLESAAMAWAVSPEAQESGATAA